MARLRQEDTPISQNPWKIQGPFFFLIPALAPPCSGPSRRKLGQRKSPWTALAVFGKLSASSGARRGLAALECAGGTACEWPVAVRLTGERGSEAQAPGGSAMMSSFFVAFSKRRAGIARSPPGREGGFTARRRCGEAVGPDGGCGAGGQGRREGGVGADWPGVEYHRLGPRSAVQRGYSVPRSHTGAVSVRCKFCCAPIGPLVLCGVLDCKSRPAVDGTSLGFFTGRTWGRRDAFRCLWTWN